MKRMAIKFGAGKARWDWKAHQVILIPEIAIIDKRHYYGYTRFAVCVSWLAWGAYVEMWNRRAYETD